MARQKLSDDDVQKRTADLKGWSVDGDKLKKRFKFDNFARALNFVNKVGAIAEEKDHHPDITFGWGYAEFEITTHDTGGLTSSDFELAEGIDEISEES